MSLVVLKSMTCKTKHIFALSLCILLAMHLLSCRDSSNIKYMTNEIVSDTLASPAPRKVRVNSIGIEFVEIPPGSFSMGCSSTPCFPDELPVRSITIRNSLLMSRCEISQRQWIRVMGTNPSHFQSKTPATRPTIYNLRVASLTTTNDNPVENITWQEAVDFCRALNVLEQTTTYRLPTEEEWEYAARASSTAERFPVDRRRWPSLPQSNLYQGARSMTFPVGSFEPNGFGLYDMDGNVREWCSTEYRAYSERGIGKALSEEPLRVSRGPCWLDPQDTRLATRYANKETSRSKLIGFRIVRDIILER